MKKTMRVLRRLFMGAIVVLFLLTLLNRAVPFALTPAVLEVKFKLTDLDYKPLPNVPARLVFLCDPDWQSPDAGYRVTTDANGEAGLTAQVKFDRHFRNKPGNFIGPPNLINHIAAGAELEYQGKRVLYVVDLVQFPDGTTIQDNSYVMIPDPSGRYTQRVDFLPDGGWRTVQWLGFGEHVTGIAFYPLNDTLEEDTSDPAHGHWKLTLALKRYPLPVRPSN